MGRLRYIYKLEIIGGLALIKKEVEADYITFQSDKYIFKENMGGNVIAHDDKVVAYYPVVNTIISSIEDNPDYVDIAERYPIEEVEEEREEGWIDATDYGGGDYGDEDCDINGGFR